MKFITIGSLASILALLATLTACKPEQQEVAQATPYPLEICLVSDEKLGEDADMVPYTFVHEGQEVKLCCKGCLEAFEKEPAKYLAKLQPQAKPALPE